jgi:DNA-3-methyladenine glycosylase I
MKKNRCPWPAHNPEMIAYHDAEWGRPCLKDKKLFEFFLLDTFQAGLSWDIILQKRNNFKKAFANFNVQKVAQFGRGEQNRLLRNSGIIRNQRKIESAITNAQKILDVQKEYGSFAKYLWSFTKGKPIQHNYKRLQDIPVVSKEAEAMSKDMKKKGFYFVGPTTLYAFMQGIGMVNDHLVSCFAHKEAKKAVLKGF